MNRLTGMDRRAGAALRTIVARAPGGARGARMAASGLSPGFRLLVAAMIAAPSSRRLGLEAGAAGVGAAVAARLLRDPLGRPRPGSRPGGGFPSRHAAAATAIGRAVARRHRAAGAVVLAAALVGMAARVATAEHDPADIVAGAALGLAAEGALAALTPCAVAWLHGPGRRLDRA
jgi:membrane-associated phospholipid phosphatase